MPRMKSRDGFTPAQMDAARARRWEAAEGDGNGRQYSTEALCLTKIMEVGKRLLPLLQDSSDGVRVELVEFTSMVYDMSENMDILKGRICNFVVNDETASIGRSIEAAKKFEDTAIVLSDDDEQSLL